MKVHWFFPVLIALAGICLGVGCSTPRVAKRTLPLPSGQQVTKSTPTPSRSVEAGHAYLHLRDVDGTIREIAWKKRSESVGRPNDGELEDGIEFPMEGPAWRRKKGFAFGTDETVRILAWAFEGIERQFPGTVPVVVGDISSEEGGKLKRHKSHQSGRDADIGYFARDNRPLRYFEKMTEATLDAEKSWALIEAFIMTGYTQYIFMSYKIQEPLYHEALEVGWSEEALGPIFQYPRGPSVRRGLIRHASGHQDHFHIRFKCPPLDSQCIP